MGQGTFSGAKVRESGAGRKMKICHFFKDFMTVVFGMYAGTTFAA
jgi:hypothetical protein